MQFKPLVRRPLKCPAFTALATLILAIGIGASVTMFTLLNAVCLKPLTYPNADRLVAMDHSALGANLVNIGAAAFLYFTYRDDGRAFQDIGMWRSSRVTITGLAEPQEVQSLDVTDSFLEMLTLRPVLGRLFTQSDASPGSPDTVVLASGYWRSKLGGDLGVINRPIVIDGRTHDIIGVLPETFRFRDLNPSVILPLRLDRNKTMLGQWNYRAVALLKTGVTLDEAAADAARLIPIAIHRFPAPPGGTARMFEAARLTPRLRFLKDDVVGDAVAVLWMLTAIISFVLVIACANVANLLLLRSDERQQELAIRLAIGAGPGDIARELLVESAILGLSGGLVGLALAYGNLRTLIALAPFNLPRLDDIAIDATVVLFTLGISLIAGALIGGILAIVHTGKYASAALSGSRGIVGATKQRNRARNALVIVQSSLAFVLLVSSGLMTRTLMALKNVSPGFVRPEQIQTFRISIPESQIKDPMAVIRMHQTIAERIAAMTGISSVGLSSVAPMTVPGPRNIIYAEDKIYADSQIPSLSTYKFVSPGLISTMGQSVIAGRDFTWTDLYEKRLVSIVSENFARELWHEPSSALGKRIRENIKGQWREIIGVVSDERTDGLDQPPPTTTYWPIFMADFFFGDPRFIQRSLFYMVRSGRTGSEGFVGEIGRTVWSVNPTVPLSDVRTMQDIYDASLARRSFTLFVVTIAGVMALVLGMVGVQGVTSYSVSLRAREIGLRIALGARRQDVVRMFVVYGTRLAAVGILCGVMLAVILTRIMASSVWGVSVMDPLTYVGVGLSLLIASMLASYIPAVRAASSNPIEALKAE